MIIRISGDDQYELNEAAVVQLHRLDEVMTRALENGEEAAFHQALHQTITYVRKNGQLVSHDRLLPSDLIIPAEDVTLAEARKLFTDEGLLEPV